LLGWAALSPYSSREAYAGVAGVSIYVAGAQRGRGLGRALLGALIEQSEGSRAVDLQAGIFTDNLASLALHQKMGFRLVGVRHHIGAPARAVGRTWPCSSAAAPA
jgi:phosphinothricin acetyltransferase